MNAPKRSTFGFWLLLFLIVAPMVGWAQPKLLDDEVQLAVQEGRVASLAIWFANGGDINLTTKEGNTLLILASKIGDKPTIEYLLSQLPDLDKQNMAGATALMIAAKYGQTHVVQMLLDSGADPAIRNNSGITAARFALAYNHADTYQLLQQALIDHYRTANPNI